MKLSKRNQRYLFNEIFSRGHRWKYQTWLYVFAFSRLACVHAAKGGKLSKFVHDTLNARIGELRAYRRPIERA